MSKSPSSPRRSLRWTVLIAGALLLAAVVDLVIYQLVAPVYEATTSVRIAPPLPPLFPEADAVANNQEAQARRLIHTEKGMFYTPIVIDSALADPNVQKSASIRDSAAPSDLIRDRLKVEQTPETFLINVAYESTVPEEAAAVVNAVVEAYLAASGRRSGSDEVLKRSLQVLLSELEQEKKGLLEESSADDESESMNRLVGERLASNRIELAETEDAARKAELERQAERLKALRHDRGSAAKAIDTKAKIDAIRRDEVHVGRKLRNLDFATTRRELTASFRVDQAQVPKAPIRDLRWVGMGAATATILLIGLTVGLHRDRPRVEEPPAPTVA